MLLLGYAFSPSIESPPRATVISKKVEQDGSRDFSDETVDASAKAPSRLQETYRTSAATPLILQGPESWLHQQGLRSGYTSLPPKL